MSRRVAQAILYPLAALLTCATLARAQAGAMPDPFAAAAFMSGPQGFVHPPVTSGLLGGYFYFPVGKALLGGHAGASVMNPRQSRAAYAVGTLGTPIASRATWQAYPFVALGSGILRAEDGPNTTRLIIGAGLGVDFLLGHDGPFTVGSRVGYLTRSAGDDNSVAFAALSVGVGVRRQTPAVETIARR